MITKGIIKTIEQGGNTCTVRLPLFEMSSKKEVIISAIISAQPGVVNNYKEEDIVLVDFENNKIDQPIVIGKLYLGAIEEAKVPRGTINCEELNVNIKASLPLTTKLVFKGDSSTNTNIDGGLSTYKTIADIIEALQKTEQKFNENSIDLDSQIAKIETVYAQIDSKDIVEAQKITNWSITIPEWKENYFIWQKTTCYNKRGQIIGEPEFICLSSLATISSYWLKCSTRSHAGAQQKDSIQITAMIKLGSAAETEDTSAVLKYKWQSDTDWTVLTNTENTVTYKVEIVSDTCKDENLLIKAYHGETEYESETIVFAPLNTPILVLTNYTDSLAYDSDGKDKLNILDTVTTTARLLLNNKEVPGVTYNWKLSDCKAEGDESPEITGSELSISSITSDYDDINEETEVTERILINSGTAVCTVEYSEDLSLTATFTINKNRAGQMGKNGKDGIDGKDGENGNSIDVQYAFCWVSEYLEIPEKPTGDIEKTDYLNTLDTNVWTRCDYPTKEDMNSMEGKSWALVFYSSRTITTTYTDNIATHSPSDWTNPEVFLVKNKDAYNILTTANGLFGYGQGVYYTYDPSELTAEDLDGSTAPTAITINGKTYEKGKKIEASQTEIADWIVKGNNDDKPLNLVKNRKKVIKLYINAEYIQTGMFTVGKDINENGILQDEEIVFQAGYEENKENGKTVLDPKVKIASFNVDKDSLYGGELEKLNNVKFNVVEPIKENEEYVANKILTYDEWRRTLDYPDNTWSEALNGNDITDLKKMYYTNYCTYTFTANDGAGNTSKSKAIRSFTKNISISATGETSTYSEVDDPKAMFSGLFIELNNDTISKKINTDRAVINTSIYLGINSPTNTENPNSTEAIITDPTYNYIIATKPFKKTAEVTIDTIITNLFNSNTGEINTDSEYEVAGTATGPFTSGALNNLTRVDYFDLKPDDTIAIIYVNTQYNKHTTVVSNEDANTYYEYEYDSSGNIVNKIEYSSGTSTSKVTNYLDECYCIIPKELAINFTTLEIGPNFKVSSSGSLLNRDATFYNNLTSNGTTHLGGFTFENSTLTSPTLTINNTGLHLPMYKTLHLNCSCKDAITDEGLTIGINSKQTHEKVLDKYESTTGNQLEPIYWLKNTITSPSIIEISSNPERDYTTDLNTTSIKLLSVPKRETIVEQYLFITPTELTSITNGKMREVTLTFRHSVQSLIPPTTTMSAMALMDYTIPIYFHTSRPNPRRGQPRIYSIKKENLVIKKGSGGIPKTVKLIFTIPHKSSVVGISFDEPQDAKNPTYTTEYINNTDLDPITFTRFYAPISYEPTIELKANKIRTDGDIYANNWYTNSDFNLKDNIISLDNSQLNNFYKDLNPVNFNFKDSPTIEHIGFIAQEIAKTYEKFFNKKLGEYSLVTKDNKTDLYSINYSNLTALNSAQIKNLILKLEDLEQKYEKLQKKYDLLVGRKDENT